MDGIPVNVFFDEPAHLERDRRTLEFLNDCWSAAREAVVATVIECPDGEHVAVGDRLFVTAAGANGPLLGTSLERELLRHARACLSERKSRGVMLGNCEVWLEWAAAPMPVVIVEEPKAPALVSEESRAIAAELIDEWMPDMAAPERRRTGFAAILNKPKPVRAPEASLHLVKPANEIDAAVAEIRAKLRTPNLKDPPELPCVSDPPAGDRFALFRSTWRTATRTA